MFRFILTISSSLASMVACLVVPEVEDILAKITFAQGRILFHSDLQFCTYYSKGCSIRRA